MFCHAMLLNIFFVPLNSCMAHTHWPKPWPGTNGLYETMRKLSHYNWTRSWVQTIVVAPVPVSVSVPGPVSVNTPWDRNSNLIIQITQETLWKYCFTVGTWEALSFGRGCIPIVSTTFEVQIDIVCFVKAKNQFCVQFSN